MQLIIKTYINRSATQYYLKNYEEAINDCLRILELDNNNYTALTSLGTIYDTLKKHDKSISNFDKAIEINPQFIDAFIGRGLAYKSMKKYNLAIEDFNQAIVLNPTNVRAYYNRALTYSDLKEYDKSISDYTIAIEHEPLDFIFENRGVTYYIKNMYSKALDDYNKGLSLNPKNANIWEAKGALYSTKNSHYNIINAGISFSRAFFLGVSRFDNFFLILDKNLTLPFLAFRLIQNHLSISSYKKRTSLIIKTFEQSNPLYGFIAHQNLKREISYTEITWKKWLGIINYYMGDPITSFKLLKKLVETESQNLMVYYYLISSCEEFAEDDELYFNQAIEIAENVYSQNTKSVLTHEQIISYYYAGMIFWLDEEREKEAIECFSKIQNNFVPASYQLLWIYHENDETAKRDAIKDYIIKKESINNQYAKGAKVHYLDLENDTLQKPFAQYFHYFEIEEAINVFGELADEEVGFEIQHSMFQEPFYELFKIRPEDLEATRLRADIAPYLEEWEATLKQTKPTEISAPTLNDFDFKNIFHALQNSVSKGEIEEDLGLAIQQFGLETKQYEELLTYFYVKGHFTEYQKLLLHFYIYYREAQQVSQSHLLGMNKVVQEVISGGLGLLTGIVTGDMVSAVVSASAVRTALSLPTAYAQGAFGELFTNFLKEDNAKNIQTYSTFKANFEVFIASERERLGGRFEERYPIEELK